MSKLLELLKMLGSKKHSKEFVSFNKATVPTPMKDGKFDAESLAVGDSAWITVSDPESPLHHRKLLIQKRPDNLLAIVGGGQHFDPEVEARRHQVLGGAPKKTERDVELEETAKEAEKYNEPIIVAKKELEEESRVEVRKAAEEMKEALGIKKVDKKQLLEQKDDIQNYVEKIVEDKEQAKRITDTITRQIVAANRKVGEKVQRERQLVVAKIGKRLSQLGSEANTEQIIQEESKDLQEIGDVQLSMPNIEELKDLNQNQLDSAVANHMDRQIDNILEDGENPTNPDEKAPEIKIAPIEKLELKSEEDLKKAINSVKSYWDKRKEAELKKGAIKKVPMVDAAPSTIAQLRQDLVSIESDMSIEELEEKTTQSYDQWLRNNTAIALYEVAAEHWNNKKSLMDAIGDDKKIDTTLKFHLNAGASIALASLAQQFLGKTVDVKRLIDASNIEVATAMVAYEIHENSKSTEGYARAVEQLRDFNATNQQSTEKKALDRHKMLKDQWNEIQKQKGSGELLDKIKISSLEMKNLLEQKRNIGAAIGSLQASATLYDQMEKLKTAKNDIIHIYAGNNQKDAEAIAERLKLSDKHHTIDNSDPDNISVKVGLDSLRKLITETQQDKEISDKYEKLKTDTSGSEYDDKGNLVVSNFDVPLWKKEFTDESGVTQPYKWRLEQRNDINWLLETTKPSTENPLGNGGGLITRVTGAGKTNTALGFFAHKMNDDPNYKGLVVVPKGRGEQWKSEAEKFTNLKIEYIPDGTARDKVDDILLDSKPGTVYVIAHREAARSSEMLTQMQTNEQLGNKKFHGFVVDEPQELQARGQSGNIGEYGKRIMRLPVNHRIGLTATPARRIPLEAHDLIKWATQTKSLGSKASFQRVYSGFGSGTNAQDTGLSSMFFHTIRPFISGDKLSTPPWKVNHNNVNVRKTDYQVQNQKEIELESAEKIATRRQEIINEVRSNPNHPLHRSENWERNLGQNATKVARTEIEQEHTENLDDGPIATNSKLTALKTALQRDSNKKHVVFIDSRTQRNSVNDIIKELGLKQSQVKNLAASTTSMTGEEMAARAEEFRRNKDVRVIFIDNKSSSGYNLQTGDHLHILGNPQDASVLLQAQGRIARSPRTGDVTVNTYMYEDNPTEQAKFLDIMAQMKMLRASSPGLFVGEK